jgi:polyhydroxyalkanoate synthesis repressor PhaR
VAQKDAKSDQPVIIKKYANRRLYNTATSSYVTLDHLCQMVKTGDDFVVYDAKTGDDITRSVLTQIIFEEEGKGQNMLPISFLRQLIAFYGDSLQALVPSYLDLTMSSFTKNQEQMRDHMGAALGELNPFRRFEDLGRQNMAMFQRAMSMFSPFGAGTAANASAEPAPEAPHPGEERNEDEIAALKSQLDAMQAQLTELAKKKS